MRLKITRSPSYNFKLFYLFLKLPFRIYLPAPISSAGYLQLFTSSLSAS